MRVFLNSYPKSGTNLVQRLLDLMGIDYSQKSVAGSSINGTHRTVKKLIRGPLFSNSLVPFGLDTSAVVKYSWIMNYIDDVKSMSYVTGHAPYSDVLYSALQHHQYKCIQVIRDPRGILNSFMRFAVEDQYSWNIFHRYFRSLSKEELAAFIVHGGLDPMSGVYHESFSNSLLASTAWARKENVLVIRFEDLIGEKGGGDSLAQVRVIENTADFLGVDVSREKITEIQDNLFGKSHTFRSGSIDKFKQSLSGELMNELSGMLKDNSELVRLGYIDDEGVWVI